MVSTKPLKSAATSAQRCSSGLSRLIVYRFGVLYNVPPWNNINIMKKSSGLLILPNILALCCSPEWGGGGISHSPGFPLPGESWASFSIIMLRCHLPCNFRSLLFREGDRKKTIGQIQHPVQMAALVRTGCHLLRPLAARKGLLGVPVTRAYAGREIGIQLIWFAL